MTGAVFADFFDGHSATVHRVEIVADAGGRLLRILPPEAEPLDWVYASLRSLPDQADATRLVVTSTESPLARLVIADQPLADALRRDAHTLRQRPPVRGRGRVLGWAAAAVASVFAIVFLLVPVMADQLARVLPTKGERALGDATLGQIRAALGGDVLPLDICETADGRAALDRMRARVSGAADLPYDVRITVLDHDLVNAFALPGGNVVFFRGMLEAAGGPDEIAAVLAHEIGHVAARDPTRIALRSAGSLGVLGLLFGDFAGGAAVLFLVERIVEADYTRAAEAAADAYGIDLLVAAGIDPAAQARLFERLLEDYGDAEGIAAHFASHPALGDRIATAAAAADRVARPLPSLSAEDWDDLRGICDHLAGWRRWE